MSDEIDDRVDDPEREGERKPPSPRNEGKALKFFHARWGGAISAESDANGKRR